MPAKLTGVRVEPSRTSAGRRIDAWRVQLPEGHAELVVTLHASRDEMLFRVRSDHPLLGDLAWEGADLGALRDRVSADVERRLARVAADRWAPGFSLEVSAERRDRHDVRRFDITFERLDLHVAVDRPPGNDGSVEVLIDGRPRRIRRRRRDDASSDTAAGSIGSDEFRFLRETPSAVDVLEADRHLSAVTAFEAALERFGALLCERFAPDRIALEGVPAPAELVEIATRAAAAEDAPRPE